MKLALVSQPFDLVPGGGSVAIWTQELTRRLAADHEITVYSRLSPGQSAAEGIDGVRHVRVATPVDDLCIRILRGVARRFGQEDDAFHRYFFSARYYRGYASKMARLIAAEGFDSVLIMNFAQFAPTLKRRNPSTHIALMMHCDWLVELDAETTDRWLASVDSICGCSRHVADGVAKRFPHRAADCHPILNGSNPDTFADSPAAEERAIALRESLGLGDRPVLLFVGRVCPEKGVHVLLEAMQRIQQEREDLVLLVVGGLSQQPPSPLWLQERDSRFAEIERLKPDYAAHLDGLASSLGDSVRLLGKVPYEDLPGYYALAQIFVHPALWEEPFGMILTEAMACGLPVVSTRSGGIPEIVIDGETGRLASRGDAKELADVILELAADPEQRAAMGRCGRTRLREKFTWDHTADQLVEMLDGDAGMKAGRA